MIDKEKISTIQIWDVVRMKGLLKFAIRPECLKIRCQAGPLIDKKLEAEKLRKCCILNSPSKIRFLALNSC